MVRVRQLLVQEGVLGLDKLHGVQTAYGSFHK